MGQDRQSWAAGRELPYLPLPLARRIPKTLRIPCSDGALQKRRRRSTNSI